MMKREQLDLPFRGRCAQASTTSQEPAVKQGGLFGNPNVVPALAMHQPYAGLLWLASKGYEAKTIETRRHATKYRGPVVFVATGQIDECAAKESTARLKQRGVPMTAIIRALSLKSGDAFCMARIAAVRPHLSTDVERSFVLDEEAGPRQAWLLESIRPLEPYYLRPMPGFFPCERSRAARALRCGCWAPFEAPEQCFQEGDEASQRERCNCFCHGFLRGI